MEDFNNKDSGRQNNSLNVVDCWETRTQFSISSKNTINQTETSLEYTRFTKSENNLTSPPCDEIQCTELFKLLNIMTSQKQQASKLRNNGSSIDNWLTNHDLKLSHSKSDLTRQGIKSIENEYFNVLKTFVYKMGIMNSEEKIIYLNYVYKVMQHAWAISSYDHKLGNSLCTYLRLSGGLGRIIENCMNIDVQFSSARLLVLCLTRDNTKHVVENGFEKVVKLAVAYARNTDTNYSRIGTGILEHLFKHSERTCYDVIRLGGLEALLDECQRNDLETLRNSARSLANLSLYGGAENQEVMINEKVPLWLFPLAFNDDNNIKYYACLAIAVLAANKEIEAEVLKCGTLDLVVLFVTSQDPSKFASLDLANIKGQSKEWLERLLRVLSSNRKESICLAAFHFCMEAGIKKEERNIEIFHEIGAIEPLKTVAGCPNVIASKFAAQTLRLIGETVPRKLSRQVPLWSVEDVQEWLKQVGFGAFDRQFMESQVDGDVLLKLNEQNLKEDIGISNGILRIRFARELQNLKKMADYSSKDCTKIYNFLNRIGSEYCVYTYDMFNAGISKFPLEQLMDNMLISECGIHNSIHRNMILNSASSLKNSLSNELETNKDKLLDVFVSYRRSNGSQLASLLKVHLQLRGFSVFIDVERLEAGKFDNNLLDSIRQAKHFILVLTSNALERCVDDYDSKDWVHREIVTALNSKCNIIPILDNFSWPEIERLPEDMRSVWSYNGIEWRHDYQDACIDKIERFMRGELKKDLISIDKTNNSCGSDSFQIKKGKNAYNHQKCNGKSIRQDCNGVRFGGHSIEDCDLSDSHDELKRRHTLNNLINNSMSRDSSVPVSPNKLSYDNLLLPSLCFGSQTQNGMQNKALSIDDIIECSDENDDVKQNYKSRSLNRLSSDFPLKVANLEIGTQSMSNISAHKDAGSKNESLTMVSSSSNLQSCTGLSFWFPF